MDDEEYSYAALQEPLYRVETGNYEYRSLSYPHYYMQTLFCRFLLTYRHESPACLYQCLTFSIVYKHCIVDLYLVTDRSYCLELFVIFLGLAKTQTEVDIHVHIYDCYKWYKYSCSETCTCKQLKK